MEFIRALNSAVTAFPSCNFTHQKKIKSVRVDIVPGERYFCPSTIHLRLRHMISNLIAVSIVVTIHPVL
eukprot:scaffold736_cov197-Ochromonas_danica.AAC.8